MRLRKFAAVAGLAVLLMAAPAGAVITRLTALEDMLSEATYVVTAHVDALDAGRPAMVLTVDAALKGKPAWTRLPVLLKGDNRAAKLKEPPELLKRLAPKLPLVLFVNKVEGEYAAFAYTDGTWFSLTGTTVDGEVRWALTHLEPYLRRTYHGTTAELGKALRAALAGKAKLPGPDSREKPGLGPEVKKTGALRKDGHRSHEFAILKGDDTSCRRIVGMAPDSTSWHRPVSGGTLGAQRRAWLRFTFTPTLTPFAEPQGVPPRKTPSDAGSGWHARSAATGVGACQVCPTLTPFAEPQGVPPRRALPGGTLGAQRRAWYRVTAIPTPTPFAKPQGMPPRMTRLGAMPTALRGHVEDSPLRMTDRSLIDTASFAIPQTADIAVIPTVLVGGPLAMLALLFPAVFGGWKRWLVLLSTGGTISTLYFGQWWFAESLAGSWWGTPAALWTTITLAAVGGLAWAWNRHLFRVQIGEAPLLAGWVELAVLAGVSVLGGGLVVGLVWLQQPLLSMAWLPTVAFVVAVWIGTLYVGWTWLRGARLIPALATEAVVLLALAVVCVAVMPLLPGRTSAGGLEAGEQAAAGGSTVELRWSFRLPDKGAIASSPLVVGDRVYVAAAHDSVFRPYGAVYCLERDTGNVLWSFSDGKKMKQVFSSPAVVGGKLYIGEGFHQDAECKVYCLDAAKGTKVWEFQTESHTESTPAVVDGRVTIGGGDDGLFALDAASGAKLWHYPGYHIDAGATVRGDRVYVGCGIGDTYRTTVLFCLDAAKGQPHWRVATELPVWSRPIVSGGFVFAGIGNGRLNEGDEHPAGAVLCVRAADGSEVWKQKMPDGVLGRLGADRRHLFFGCRDGSVYCLHRHDGSLAWRRDLGSPVVAGPALDVSAGLESLASRLVAVSIGGQLVCVEPATGKLLWSKVLVERTKVPVEVIATPALEPTYDLRGREGWRLYVGLTLVSSARVGELHCYQESAAETSQP